MKAFILAAGLGQRLRPITLFMPKPMLPIINKPILNHNLNWLKSNHIHEVVINLHHLPKSILSAEIPSDMKIEYSYEADILGTAGGLKKVEPFLKNETFLMMNSDTLIELNLQEVLDFHRQKGALATMVLREARPEFGQIEIDGKGRIREFLGKIGQCQTAPLTPAMFCGIHIFEPEIFDCIPPNMVYEINQQVYPQLIKEGKKVYGYLHKGYWNEIGIPERYWEVHKDILDKKLKFDFGLEEIEEGIWAGKEVDISPEAQILPPVIIGDKAKIEDGAIIGKYAIIGRNCWIGQKSQVEESIIWDEIALQPERQIKKVIMVTQFQSLSVAK